MPGGQITTKRNGCASCKGRATSYQRAGPNCPNCSQPDLKLSWPRDNDRRRAIVSKSSPPTQSNSTAGHISDARFVHTSNWDIELYQSLTSSVPARTLLFLDSPAMFWAPSKLEALNQDLLEYFYCVASASLATFGQDATALGHVLVRMALEGETASAAALLQALLAFASLHCYGFQSQAVELKIAALKSLAESFVPNLGARETIQHIATGMVLCSFETHQSSRTSGHWTQYVCGVKTVINASSIDTLVQFDSDVTVLLDWVHYHDALARFSLLHGKEAPKPQSWPNAADIFRPQISTLPPAIFSMLSLLSQVCDTVSSSAMPPETNDQVEDYKGFLGVLDWRIRKLPIPKVDEHADDATLVMQLYKLAILLFLNRSSEGLIDQPIRTQQQLNQAFALLPLLSHCKQQFPIYVIGCEARTDEQRAVVLDVISRTEKMGSSRSWNYCKSLLQAVWAQDDLAESNNISYRDKLTLVMSLCVIVPFFG